MALGSAVVNVPETTSEVDNVDGGRFAARCWCGSVCVEVDVAVEGPPRLAVAARCPDHGRVIPRGVVGQQVIDLLEVVPGALFRWDDLMTAAVVAAVVLTRLPTPVLLVDPDAHAVFSNRAWSELTGMSSRASRGQRWLTALEPERGHTLVGSVTSDLAIPVSLAIGARRSKRLLLSSRLLQDYGRNPIGHMVALTDPATSTSPPVTGAGSTASGPLRHRVVESVDRALVRQSGADSTMAVLLLQMDEPGDEDTTRSDHHHPITDIEVLDATRDRITRLSPPGDRLFELGEGRFALLEEQVTSYGHAVGLARRLVDSVTDPVGLTSSQKIHASVGVAFPHLPDETAERFLANAERAVAVARRLGGQRVEVVIGSGPASSDAAPPAEVGRLDD